MSTTVNYKGSTIATVTNETKTLNTEGTWLEDDIELVDESEGTAVVVTDVANSTGTTCQIVGDVESYIDYTSALIALGVN